MLPAFITTVLYSFSALFAQRTARALGGISANFWRMLLATVCLAAWSHLFGAGWQGPARGWLFVSGIIGFGIGDVALFQALPRLGSRLSILLVHCLATPTAAIAEYFWLGSRLTGWQMACIGVSLSGVAVALTPGRGQAPRPRQIGLGLLFGILAMLGQALGAVVSRKANLVNVAAEVKLSGIDMAYQRALGGILVSAIVFFIYRIPRLSAMDTPAGGVDSSPRVWLWVVGNTLAGPVLGVSCFQWALATTPTGIVLPIVALTPLVIIPFAHWMENERSSWREVLGGVIAVAGVAALAACRAYPHQT